MEHITTVHETPPDFQCQICHQLMIFPAIIPECGHTYCKDCLVRVQNQGAAKHCPSCRTPISSELKTNFTVKKLVENLEAKCDLCQLEGKIEQLANHKCPEEEIKCENGQCSTKVKRKDQERHEEECIFKVVFCERCHRSTTVANLEIHREETCPEGETNCPLKCTKRPKRRELQLHLSECRQRQRECNIVGCKFWGNSRSLAEHNKDEAERHVSLLLIENRKLQEALLGANKDALKTRTVESITSFYWNVNSFRQRTRVIMAATDDAPLISPEFQWDTRDWRMVLYIQATECKLYLQLMQSMSPTRIAIRFLICGDDDKIFTLEDEVMAEGQMLGTAVPFSLLEKKVEETGGFLHVKIFIEKINRTC
ncbi:unnamed protein product [Porites evermanni]|uniref:Uncharacterized protein n=2 Tax=Porites evermanni TaxID=104178 RepID=A0ABN8SRG9_9CNID|nr:unnamed protein product [Porites evermanni]